MGEFEHLRCEHDIRNGHACYSTNLSTKTPSVRISKNENRNKNLYFDFFKFANFFLSQMGVDADLHCEHDLRNEHACYSTNLSTKTPSVRITKNENRNKILFFDIQILLSFSFADGLR